MTLEHPELTPEVLDRLGEVLEKFGREATPQDGMVLQLAQIFSTVWHAGQAGKHPEIAVMTDLCRNVIHAAAMLGGCKMAEFYLENLKTKEAPEKLFTHGGQQAYWVMVHNCHADLYNEILKSLPNLAEHAYRDGPGPLPPFPWETPNEAQESPAAGADGRNAPAGRESEPTGVQAGADSAEGPQDRGLADPGSRRSPTEA